MFAAPKILIVDSRHQPWHGICSGQAATRPQKGVSRAVVSLVKGEQLVSSQCKKAGVPWGMILSKNTTEVGHLSVDWRNCR